MLILLIFGGFYTWKRKTLYRQYQFPQLTPITHWFIKLQTSPRKLHYLILFCPEPLSNIAKPVTTLFVTYIRILKFIEFFPANVIWIFSPKHSTSQKGTLSWSFLMWYIPFIWTIPQTVNSSIFILIRIYFQRLSLIMMGFFRSHCFMRCYSLPIFIIDCVRMRRLTSSFKNWLICILLLRVCLPQQT